ncbi:hypothetical protein [Streptomyces sp. NPDC048172]|uniref:hypothetical protein n=1 Tax=Streptomyces sp. NPDC048172 TaxID=3365505 RepID=UPI00371416AC
MAEAPHITIGHHPQVGVVAAPSRDHHVTDHLLRRLGFERLDDSDLYVLADPARDPVRRTQLAVQALRAARQSVSADAAYDLHPGEHPSPPGDPTKAPPFATASAQQRRVQAATASSPARRGIAVTPSTPPVEHSHRPSPAATQQPAPHL